MRLEYYKDRIDNVCRLGVCLSNLQHKEHAYMEIDLQVEDQEHVSIVTNRNPVVAWNTLRSIYGNRLANIQAALLAEISHI